MRIYHRRVDVRCARDFSWEWEWDFSLFVGLCAGVELSLSCGARVGLVDLRWDCACSGVCGISARLMVVLRMENRGPWTMACIRKNTNTASGRDVSVVRRGKSERHKLTIYGPRCLVIRRPACMSGSRNEGERLAFIPN